jgi:two-component system response regulator FlrC
MTSQASSVLVVDDEPPIREFLTDLLTGASYTVRTAKHGRAALASVDTNPPDLVLSDIYMPQLDGWSLAAEIRRRFPGIEVVLMSAYRPEFPVDRIRFIRKPFDLDALLQVVADAASTN